MTTSKWAVRCALSALLLLTAGCGGDAGDDSDPIVVGTVTGILPYEGFDDDGRTLIGYEPDLIREAAKGLDREVQFQVVEFDAVLPGLASERFDIAAAGWLDTAEREKDYDAVSITVDRYGFIAQKDTAAQLKSLGDLCGLTVAVVSGSSQAQAVQDQADSCPADDSLTVRTFDAEAQGFLALKSGQVDAVPSNVPLLTQYAKDNPDFAVGPVSFNPGPTALFFRKGSPLAKEMQEQIQQMMDDGRYAAVLKKWDIEDVAAKEAKLNGASDS